MTLSKQLMLLISFMFLVIFTVNFYTSISNIRDYLEIESEVHAQDTATSLGLSLSPYIADQDDTILETMINAIFDRGYYLEILLKNIEGQELVRKTNPKSFKQVPDWFVNILPMKTVTAESEISAGWVPGGTVYITIHPGFGYLKLWEQAKRSLTYSAIALLIFVGVLVLIIQLVLRPLKRIDKLALSIADGNFDTIHELPWTTEIRNVASSMNLMSGKIERVIKNLNTRLEETGRRIRVDELTGLETKNTFETEMKQRFMTDNKGYIFILRIDDLGGFSNERTRQEVDSFIKNFVQTIRGTLSDLKLSGEFLYRIVGAEFILITDTPDKGGADQLCQQLAERLTKLGEQYNKPNVVHFGGVAFDPHGTTATMVSAATEAYEKARLIGINSYAITESSSGAHDMDQWKSMVGDIIENQRFELEFIAQAFGLTEETQDQLIIEEAVTKVFDEQGESLPIGTFVSVAENIGKILAFDLQVVERVINYIQEQEVQHQVAVNLSFTSLSSNEFRSKLYDLLQEHKAAATRITFSVTAYSATKDLTAFSSFISFAHRNNCKVILKRFEIRFIPMDQVKEFKLDYIRLARTYTENIGMDDEKRRLVQAMKELGDLLDIQIIAEAVEADEDYQRIREIGLTAASR